MRRPTDDSCQLREKSSYCPHLSACQFSRSLPPPVCRLKLPHPGTTCNLHIPVLQSSFVSLQPTAIAQREQYTWVALHLQQAG